MNVAARIVPILLGVAACTSSTGSVCPVCPLAMARPTTPQADPLGPRVTHLDRTSRVPLIDRADGLVASYEEVPEEDGTPRRLFVARSSSLQILMTDRALTLDPSPEARERAVDAWLSRADWRAMAIATSSEREPEYDVWTFPANSMTIKTTRAHPAQILFFDEPDKPWRTFAHYAAYPDPRSVSVDLVAFDPLSKTVWTLYPGARVEIVRLADVVKQAKLVEDPPKTY